MDKYFRVEVLEQAANPQRLIYAAMHQDYSEGFVWDGLIHDHPERSWLIPEDRAGELIVKNLLAGHRGHYGPLEHPQITINCGWFPHSTMQQIRTHRVGISVDCQCLAASTVVTFVNIEGHSAPKLKKTIGELYDLWHNGERAIRERKVGGRNGEPPGQYRRDCKTRIRKMRVRSLDEETNTFTENHIEDVVFNGINPVYKVTLEDGKTLECTQNHKIYTPYGWRILAQLSVGSEVMVNGHPLANADKTYQNKDWLESQFRVGLKPKDLAAIAGCSKEAIKKWAYIHGLTWEKESWNKGSKYNINISDAERDRRRAHARNVTQSRKESGLIPSGENHPQWKNLPPEKRAYNWLRYHREQILNTHGNKCSRCGSTKKLCCHHIETVKNRPDLAFDFSNFEVLCSTCHTRHHHANTKNPLCSHPVKIIAIEYKGVEATYDLVMKAPHHNFVANGIVVHNSFRYTGKRIVEVAEGVRDIEEVFYLRPVNTYSDRQGNHYSYDTDWRERDKEWCLAAAKNYTLDIKRGKSEEHARGIIPFDVRQHWVLSCNVRSLMHLLDLRAKADAQLEAQQLCELIWPHFQAWVPAIADWYEKNRLHKARLAP